MILKQYNRNKAKDYAEKWAGARNPIFYNYEYLGGDCTNFVSQCIFAGTGIMNYNRINGWYYISANDKSPSWTGVEFLYDFLINNKSVGPFGKEVSREDVDIGDIIQLSFDGTKFGHTLIVVNKFNNKIYIATHTFDCYNRDLDTYSYVKARFIKIDGLRTW